MLKQQTLFGDTVAAIVSNDGEKSCKKCPLKKANSYVAPQMVDNAEFLLVVETPLDMGNTALSNMLKKFGVPYSVTTVCKCIPPEDRTPTANEIKNCSPMLLGELNDHKNIVLAGAASLAAVFPKAKFMDLIGTIIQDRGKRFLVVHSPSYIAAMPDQEHVWKQDLGRVGDLLSSYYGDFTYKVVGKDVGIDEAIEALKHNDRFEIDIEASGLDRHDFTMYCIGVFGDKDDAPYVFPYNEEWIIKLNDLFKGKACSIHNALYDVAMLLKVGIDLKDSMVYDTMFMAYLMDENRKQSYGLKNLGRYKLGYKYWNLIVNWDEVDMDEVYRYNAEDLVVSKMLFAYFWERMSDKQKFLLEEIISGALKGVSEIEDFGMFVDLDSLSSIKKRVKRSIETILDELKEFGDINWNSPMQVGELLYSMGVTDVKRTKTGRVSLDKSAVVYMLERYSSGPVYGALSRLQEYGKLETMLSTFLEGTFSKVGAGGRVRSSYSFVNTVSGRLASSKPNLQNVPRDSRIKSLFVPEPGYIFVEGDMSQIELRVAAVIANDYAMISALRDGKDLHRLTASLVMGKQEESVTKEERQKAKAVNFGFLYGQGWMSFKGFAKSQYGVELSDKEAQEWRQRFFKEYYGLAQWHKDVEDKVRADKFVESPLGRVRRLHEDMSSPYKDRVEHAIRQAVNSPVQGTASDITMMIVGELYKIRNKNSSREEARLVGTVHDSLVMEVKLDKVEECKQWIDAAIKEVHRKLPWFSVPLEIDLKVTEKWE